MIHQRLFCLLFLCYAFHCQIDRGQCIAGAHSTCNTLTDAILSTYVLRRQNMYVPIVDVGNKEIAYKYILCARPNKTRYSNNYLLL